MDTFDQKPRVERPVSPAPSDVSMKSDRSKNDPLNFREEQQRKPRKERPVSPAPSDGSMNSDRSKNDPPNFREDQLSRNINQLNVKSDRSKNDPINFREEQQRRSRKERPVSPAPSDVSMNSDRSKNDPLNFSEEQLRRSRKERPVSPAPSDDSMNSDRSKNDPINFREEQQSSTQSQRPGLSESTESEDPLDFNSGLEKDAKEKLKEQLKEKILKSYEEELRQHGTDTELYDIRADGNKVQQTLVKSYNDIFTLSESFMLRTKKTAVRTVLTKGVAGIGKTFQTKLFMVDWAKGNSNKDTDLIVSLRFSQVSSRKEVISMEDLFNDCLTDVKHEEVSYEDCKIIFVLDGLEKCELPLDFEKNENLSDLKKAATMDVLLTNLIKGNLLPSARLWIISQPSGVKKIPPKYINKQTECQGKDAKEKLKKQLKEEILKSYEEELSQHGTNTELYDIRADGNKVKQTLVKSYNDIFTLSESSWFQTKKMRTVLTKGVAGIGKTFQTKLFMVDWAKGNSNTDIDLIVSLRFSELSSRKEVESMEDLVNRYITNVRHHGVWNNSQCRTVFILDGLEECKLPLDFEKNEDLSDLKKAATMDVLLTNLIKGNLLPSARLWIISQPPGVKKIPPKYIDKETECQVEDAKKKLKEDLKKILKTYEKDLSQHRTDRVLYEIKAVQNEYEQTLVRSYNDIFTSSAKKTKMRTVLTKGVAGIGKTFQTKLFMVDWAKGKYNKDIDLIVSLSFSELSSGKEVQSMEDLINRCLTHVKQKGVSYEDCKIVFVLDGLEKCKLPLDFENNKDLSDLKKAASMDVLLTNLIKGNLLPSARLWIISQPPGVKKIPPEYIDKETECQEKDAKEKLKKQLKEEILKLYEKELRQHATDTELYDIRTDENKVEQTLVNYNDIFTLSKSSVLRTKTIARTVLTKGVAGIGKTFQTKLFMVDWAKGNSNTDIDLIVSLRFSELSSRTEVQSMEDLVNRYITNVRHHGVWNNRQCKTVFILDGLEECELPLENNEVDVSDLKKAATMDVLLRNFIKGNLLPSARLWIISQPSGVKKIPPDYIQKVSECRETLKRRQQLTSKLRERFCTEYSQDEDLNHLNQKNTEHIMRGDTVDVSDGDKSGQTGKISVNPITDIFKDRNGQKVRAVLTIGEANIGKSFHMKKFIKEWAKSNPSIMGAVFSWLKDTFTGKAKEDELVIFPLNLSALNVNKEKVSLVGLLNHFFEETKKHVISDFAQFKVVFTLDGLDAYKHPLDFDNKDTVTDIREKTSVDVLLTNLIRGNLLPSASLWITSRPPDAERLPADSVHRTTEIREKPDVASQRKLKSQLKEQFNYVYEGTNKKKTSALLSEIFTDLYIIKGERGEVNVQSETRQVQDAKFKPKQETPIKYHDIFKTISGETKPIRTVLTIGMAGIGKTFASMKYMLDWAEGKAFENIYYMFPLPFRELNLRKESEHSFEELIHQFFPVMKTSEIKDYNMYKILIVLDGFDECRLDLNFSESTVLKDMKTSGSVNVLLTNLIQGNLLPEAQIWITSRPAASNNIPAGKVDRVTEVRGFNDEQKEEYFKKRFSNKELAEKILSHVKKSRSLYIMCHIPVFCWITSEVLEDFVSRNQEEGMPKTLTDMYIHLLLLQCRQANVKYCGDETNESSEMDSCWNTRNKETILSLSKLAFEELEKGNLLFTEHTLTERGIDITNAAVFSGLFTQIKRESSGLYLQKLFCFAHMSIQEFLAALYSFCTFNNNDENLLTVPPTASADLPPSDFYRTAVDKALNSENGDWDLFLRFLLGLSLETNQNLLQELLKKTENKNTPTKELTNKETIEHIKGKIQEISDADKKLNLFYCLNELNDHSLVNEVKKYLQSETSFESFSDAQWSALTFVLLTSDENLDVFDLKKYLKSEKVLLGMLPVVKVSKTTLLSWCKLSEESCKGLTKSVLMSASSNLTTLDLSHNDLLDSGVESLADGLKNLQCKLEILKLSGCQVTEKGCSSLASALKSKKACLLKELDLSYNYPGDNGVRDLSAVAEDPSMKLTMETLCFDYGGEHRLKPGLKKYCVDLKFDENTAGKRLVLSEGNRRVRTKKKVEEKISRPENEDRFKRTQVLCEEGLNGICYWEMEWKGTVGIAVTYEDVGRKWDRSGGLGCNDMSWSLVCSESSTKSCFKRGYTAIHGNKTKHITELQSQRIAVFLDWERGILRYYSISSGELSLIHTFHATFTQPLFPALWFQRGLVTLCEID